MNFLTAILVMATAATEPIEIFVAPNGNDSWSGHFAAPSESGDDGPLATLPAARDAVRNLRTAGAPARPVTVQLRTGEYVLREALTFGPDDGGTADAPVTWQAYAGERPVVSGALQVSGWEERDGRLVAPYPDGIETAESLWIDERRVTVARTPDEGSYFHTAGTVADYPARAFQFHEDDAANFRDADQGRVVAFHSWETSTHVIESLDFGTREVLFSNDAHWPFERWGAKQRYYIENTLTACDTPGEWFADDANRELYYVPLPHDDLERVPARIATTAQLLLIHGEPERPVQHLAFEGIQFAYTDFLIGDDGHSDAQAAFTVSAAIDLQWAKHCQLRNLEIRNTGGYAIWFNTGSEHCSVTRSALRDLGAGGIRVGASSKPSGAVAGGSHIPANNVIDNNHIHQGGRKFHAGVGVWIGHAHHTDVTHNSIRDFYYTGVSNGWVWGYGDNPSHHNRIEFNHIYQIGQKVLSDMGGIYNLGVQPGSTNRNNLIHDIASFHYGGWGLYTDEGSTGILIENNIVYNTNDGSFHQHYGKENIVQNNILVNSETEQIKVTRVEEHRSLTFRRNIVVSQNGRVCPPNWGKADLVSDYNLYWDTKGTTLDFGGLSFKEWQEQTGRDEFSIVQDPKFIDLEKHDFTMEADSPARLIGFEPIDVEKIGPYGDGPWVRQGKASQLVLHQGFGKQVVGALPRSERLYGIAPPAVATISIDRAAGGAHSLKVTDAPGSQRPQEPELVWRAPVQEGTAVCRFSVWPEAGAAIRVEMRGGTQGEHLGPWWAHHADGSCEAAGTALAQSTAPGWIEVELAVPVTEEASTFDCYTRFPDGSTVDKTALPITDSEFRGLERIHILSPGEDETVYYLDRLQVLAYD